MKYIREALELEGVKVITRLDLNVPFKGGQVENDFRIRKILPTIAYLQQKKAKIILISHIESNFGVPSLLPVRDYMEKLGINCQFVKNYRNAGKEIENLPNGGVILLENLREHEGEIKNDKDFAGELASLGDIYVNEAFAVSHRAHASVVAITEFVPSYAGILFEKEIRNLSTAFKPPRPFIFILGGAKFETKLPLIEKFINIADKIYLGGALSNDFLKEEGKETGKSLTSSQNFNLKRFMNNPKLVLPVDSIVSKEVNAVKPIDEISRNEIMYDIGPKSVKAVEEEIMKAKYILWNGPMGAYEEGYSRSTLEIAKSIAEATKAGARTILGGGDTLAAIAELKLEDEFTFVSTGGGAMLEFLAQGTLPGIKALEANDL